MQEMSANGTEVSWSNVGKVLDDEMSSIEDIRTDLVRNDKGNVCQSIDNCMTVFQILILGRLAVSILRIF